MDQDQLDADEDEPAPPSPEVAELPEGPQAVRTSRSTVMK
jgi:hypothetical protein